MVSSTGEIEWVVRNPAQAQHSAQHECKPLSAHHRRRELPDLTTNYTLLTTDTTGDESYRISPPRSFQTIARTIAPAECVSSSAPTPANAFPPLGRTSAPSLSPTIAIGFWTVSSSLTPLPPARSSDGGPALQPLSRRFMRRESFSSRVNGLMVALGE